jgi:hypothetical protein
MRQDELAARTIFEGDRATGLRIDQFGVHETSRTEVHTVLFLALAPQRDTDISDPHRLRYARSPAALERRAEGGLPAAWLTGDEYPLNA